MQKHSSSESASSILAPTTPVDIGEQSQRRRIIEAMIASCAEKTYAGTTITDIVARARISRTTFYKRFADKRACFDATIEYCLAQLREAAAGSHSPGDPPPEAVRKATVTVLELLAEKPAVAQLLSGEAVSVQPAVVERYRELLIPAIEGLWDAAGEPKRPHVDPRLAFARAQLLIFNEVAAGHSDELLALLPETVYLAVAPFAGHDEALRQARLAEDPVPDAQVSGGK